MYVLLLSVSSSAVAHPNIRHLLRPTSSDSALDFDQSERFPTGRSVALNTSSHARPTQNSLSPRSRTIISSMPSTALVFSLLLLALYVAQTVRTYLSLRQFGGHWSVGWSRIWLLRTGSCGEMNKRFTEVNIKYGEYPILTASMRSSSD